MIQNIYEQQIAKYESKYKKEQARKEKKEQSKKFRSTKIIVSVIFVALLCTLFFIPNTSFNVLASNSSTDVSGELQNNVNNILGGINFGNLDDILAGLDGGLNFFGGDSFMQRVGRILSGEFQGDYPNIVGALFGLFGAAVLSVFPVIALIVGISILSGLFQSLKLENSSDGVKSVIHFVTYAAVVTIVMVFVGGLTLTVGRALDSMKQQMDIIFPILLTLMVSIGGNAGASVYQPAVAILSNGVMQIFSAVVMPLFIMTLVFSVVGHLSPNTKLDKFVSFFTSAFKWIVGIVFTVFLAFLSIQGITAGVHDGISIRAARFTISSYVPILGGYISQGFDLVLASSVLVKNAIGLAGLYLLMAVVLAPLLQIVVFSLGLKLAAAVTQPIADDRISNFLTSINKSFGMLATVLIGAAFMYFVTIGLVMITGNVL
ncbi:MAG: stage III sporulation protein AE [Firmicutes bacterium]|nr:stage III sporulation protein AE [Bacillota bacterium]